MKKLKTLLSSLLILSIFCSQSVLALDSNELRESGSSGTTAITLDIKPAADTFMATIPATIPMAVDSSGAVTVPTNARVENLSSRSIKIDSIDVHQKGDWSLVDYSSGPSSVAGTHEFSIGFNGDYASSTDGSVEIVNNAQEIKSSEKYNLGITAKVSPQTQIGNLGNIANVEITLDWYESVEEADPDSQITIRYAIEQVGYPTKVKIVGSQHTIVNLSDIKEGWTPTFPDVEANLGWEAKNWYYIDDGQRWASSRTDWRYILESGLTEWTYYTTGIPGTYDTWEIQYIGNGDVKMCLNPEEIYNTYGFTIESNATSYDTAVTDKLIIRYSGSVKQLLLPDLYNTSSYDTLQFIDTMTNSLMYDYGTDEGGILWDGAELKDNGKTIVYVLRLNAVKGETKYSTATFHAGTGGKILNPETSTFVDTYVKDFPIVDNQVTVSFPGIKANSGQSFDTWVNSSDGSDVEEEGIKSDADGNYDFTAIYKEQPSVTVTIQNDSHCTIIGSTTVVLKPGQSANLPTVRVNSGYDFDGWYYTNGILVEGSGTAEENNNLKINPTVGGGTYNEAQNMYYVTIIARTKLASSTYSLFNVGDDIEVESSAEISGESAEEGLIELIGKLNEILGHSSSSGSDHLESSTLNMGDTVSFNLR